MGRYRSLSLLPPENSGSVWCFLGCLASFALRATLFRCFAYHSARLKLARIYSILKMLSLRPPVTGPIGHRVIPERRDRAQNDVRSEFYDPSFTIQRGTG